MNSHEGLHVEPQKEQRKEPTSMEDKIYRHFDGFALCSDVCSQLLTRLQMIAYKKRFEQLNTPMMHYSEYVEYAFSAYGDEYVQAIMEQSDASVVSQFDSAIDTFNEDMERIRNESDEAALKQFIQDVGALFSIPSSSDKVIH